MKRCVVRVRGSKRRHEVSVDTLQELTEKALQLFNLNATGASISLVLANDGTKVDSNDFFLCLPERTEFLALIGSKKWACSKIDGGTIWMKQESIDEMASPHLASPGMSPENYGSIFLYSSDVPDICANDTETLPPDMNGNVQQLQVEEETQNTSLLSSIYQVVKVKLSPKVKRKHQVEEELQG